jgi:hypothetical protein
MLIYILPVHEGIQSISLAQHSLQRNILPL